MQPGVGAPSRAAPGTLEAELVCRRWVKQERCGFRSVGREGTRESAEAAFRASRAACGGRRCVERRPRLRGSGCRAGLGAKRSNAIVLSDQEFALRE